MTISTFFRLTKDDQIKAGLNLKRILGAVLLFGHSNAYKQPALRW